MAIHNTRQFRTMLNNRAVKAGNASMKIVMLTFAPALYEAGATRKAIHTMSVLDISSVHPSESLRTYRNTTCRNTTNNIPNIKKPARYLNSRHTTLLTAENLSRNTRILFDAVACVTIARRSLFRDIWHDSGHLSIRAIKRFLVRPD